MKVEYETNPVKAIRAKCIDCSGGQLGEVRLCPVKACPLYPFRMGDNPFRAKAEKKPMTDIEKAAFAERMKKAKGEKG